MCKSPHKELRTVSLVFTFAQQQIGLREGGVRLTGVWIHCLGVETDKDAAQPAAQHRPLGVEAGPLRVPLPRNK